MSSLVNQAIFDTTGNAVLVANAGAAGAGYQVFSPTIAVNNGVADSDWYFFFRGEQGSVPIASVRRYVSVVLHFYASNSRAVPASAASIATFASDDTDLLPDRAPKTGFIYIETVAHTFPVDFVQDGTTANVYCKGFIRHRLALLQHRGVGATARRNVVCVCISDQGIRSDLNNNLPCRLSVMQRTVL